MHGCKVHAATTVCSAPNYTCGRSVLHLFTLGLSFGPLSPEELETLGRTVLADVHPCIGLQAMGGLLEAWLQLWT